MCAAAVCKNWKAEKLTTKSRKSEQQANKTRDRKESRKRHTLCDTLTSQSIDCGWITMIAINMLYKYKGELFSNINYINVMLTIIIMIINTFIIMIIIIIIMITIIKLT